MKQMMTVFFVMIQRRGNKMTNKSIEELVFENERYKEFVCKLYMSQLNETKVDTHCRLDEFMKVLGMKEK